MRKKFKGTMRMTEQNRYATILSLVSRGYEFTWDTYTNDYDCVCGHCFCESCWEGARATFSSPECFYDIQDFCIDSMDEMKNILEIFQD